MIEALVMAHFGARNLATTYKGTKYNIAHVLPQDQIKNIVNTAKASWKTPGYPEALEKFINWFFKIDTDASVWIVPLSKMIKFEGEKSIVIHKNSRTLQSMRESVFYTT